MHYVKSFHSKLWTRGDACEYRKPKWQSISLLKLSAHFLTSLSPWFSVLPNGAYISLIFSKSVVFLGNERKWGCWPLLGKSLTSSSVIFFPSKVSKVNAIFADCQAQTGEHHIKFTWKYWFLVLNPSCSCMRLNFSVTGHGLATCLQYLLKYITLLRYLNYWFRGWK